MIWIVGIIVGAIRGLLLGLALKSSARGTSFFYLIMGIIGGLLGVWFFSVLLGFAAVSTSVNIWLSILWALIGSAVIVAIFDLVVSMTLSSVMTRREETRGEATSYGVAHEYDTERPRRRRMSEKERDEEMHRHDDDMRDY